MSAPQSAPRRPRLSLQTQPVASRPSTRSSRTLSAIVDPQSPTAFNTLSNVYVTAIERSTPAQAEPVTAIKLSGQPLRIQTQDIKKDQPAYIPYVGPLLRTPVTGIPQSPAPASDITLPSTMAPTPPLSAGGLDSAGPKAPWDRCGRLGHSVGSPAEARRRTTFPQYQSSRAVPYVHPRTLHSILRNSPLPPSSVKSPSSPRRQSARLAEKAARRVGYDNPLTQTITTQKYVRSHVDLLSEDASPSTFSPATPAEDPEVPLDMTMAYGGNETRDGGQTPGPFEEMRRRMAGLQTHSPVSPSGSIRKRKRKDRERDKKRRWVWTLGQEDEGDDEEVGGAIAAIRAAEAAKRIETAEVSAVATSPPAVVAAAPAVPSIDITLAAETEMEVEVVTPSVESASQESVFEDVQVADADADVTMSDTSSLVSDAADQPPLTPVDMDIDLTTPIAVTRSAKDHPHPRPSPEARASQGREEAQTRLSSEDLFDPETRQRKDTPLPAELVVS